MSEIKTPEEILDKYTQFSRKDFGLPGSDDPQFMRLKHIKDAMTVYASQQSRSTAIGFAEWKDDNYISYQMTDDLYYHKRDLLKHIDQATVFTLPELYALYLQSLTNQNKEG